MMEHLLCMLEKLWAPQQSKEDVSLYTQLLLVLEAINFYSVSLPNIVDA